MRELVNKLAAAFQALAWRAYREGFEAGYIATFEAASGERRRRGRA
jgi:hypothetical protein